MCHSALLSASLWGFVPVTRIPQQCATPVGSCIALSDLLMMVRMDSSHSVLCGSPIFHDRGCCMSSPRGIPWLHGVLKLLSNTYLPPQVAQSASSIHVLIWLASDWLHTYPVTDISADMCGKSQCAFMSPLRVLFFCFCFYWSLLWCPFHFLFALINMSKIHQP